MDNLRVTTKYGVVRGMPDGDSILFKGVPFAKPPVGELRFHSPVEPEPWEGELDCTKAHSVACQYNRRKISAESCLKVETKEEVVRPTISEDCLYLNIWTPAERKEGEKLAVLCWIHGGMFTIGWGHEPEIDGKMMNQKGVILVTIGYRLGAMGFLAHPEFAKRDVTGTTGNYGFLDQIAALRWIKENIAAFGGDPDRITVHGYSAGGISSKLHLVSPLSRDLIFGSVVQSGGGLNAADPTRPVEELAQITQETMDRLGWTVEDLMTLPAEEMNTKLCDMAAEVIEKKEIFVFQPCIDGYSIVEEPEKSIAEGNYNQNVNVICGTVKGDFWMFSRKVQSTLREQGLGDAIPHFAKTAGEPWARNNQRKGFKPIRTYYFEHLIPGPEKTAPHGVELPYLFGTLSTIVRPWTEFDYRLQDAVNGYWANFAKTGDPNGEGLPLWPYNTEETPFAMHMTDDTIMAENIVTDPMAERVVEYTVAHPGMLHNVDEF